MDLWYSKNYFLGLASFYLHVLEYNFHGLEIEVCVKGQSHEFI